MRPSDATRRRLMLWGAFWLLLVLTVLNDVQRFRFLVQYLNREVDAVATPLRVRPGSAEVMTASRRAQRAGIVPGDTIIAVNGERYVGAETLNRPIMYGRPGNVLTLGLIRATEDAAERTVSLPLVRRPSIPSDNLLLQLALFLVLPLTCQWIGFWAVRVRPSNVAAWLVLAVTLSASQVLTHTPENGDGSRMANLSLVYSAALAATPSVWLLLLALYLPPPFRGVRIVRRVAWLLAIPISVVGLWQAAFRLLDIHSYAAAAMVTWGLDPANTLATQIEMVAFAGLAVVMVGKLTLKADPDTKRRLRLVCAGLATGLLPTSTLVAVSRQSGIVLDQFSPVVLSLCLLSTLILPLTLAYVVVVPRAPSLSVLLRETLRHVFSPVGLFAVRLIVAAVVLVTLAVWGAASELIEPRRAEAIVGTGTVLLLVLEPRLIRRVEPIIARLVFRRIHQSENALVDIDEFLRRATGRGDLLDTLQAHLAAVLGVGATSVLVNTGHGLRDTRRSAEEAPAFASDSAVTRRMTEVRVPQLVGLDEPGSWVAEASESDRARLRELDSQVLVPLVARDGLLAVISLGAKRFDAPFSSSELGLLASVANRAALGLENLDLVERLTTEAAEAARMKVEKLAAEKATAAKSVFLASMSHELRTPLNAIIGYSEMLLEDAGPIATGAADDLRKIHFAGKHLLELINSVLDISKIEAGKMEVFVQLFELDDVVTNVVDLAKPLMIHKRNRLVVDRAGPLGLMQSDRTKVRQTLFNLLSNASKFTENGRVTLQVGREQIDGREWVRFSVSDTGIGMTEAQLARVFEAFVQADASTSGTYGGSGLGLNITKRFCEMLGGGITVSSRPGEGTTFSITLPAVLDAADQPTADTAAAADPGRATVLVIDDDPTVHDIVRRSLAKDDIHVITACDGDRGLELARRYQPSVIVLDIIMKQVSGWEVLATMKSDAVLSEIPVVVLSITDNRSAGYALGAADYLVKPVDRTLLINVLSRHCRTPRHAGLRSALIVDDDGIDRARLRDTLSAAGWVAHEAADGADALLLLQESTPDIIILDLLMPRMDGFEFMEALRHSSRPAIPVIVMTAKDLTPDDRARLEGRVSLVLEKHQQTERALLTCIRSQVERHVSVGAM